MHLRRLVRCHKSPYAYRPWGKIIIYVYIKESTCQVLPEFGEPEPSSSRLQLASEPSPAPLIYRAGGSQIPEIPCNFFQRSKSIDCSI